MKTALFYPYIVPKADEFRESMKRFYETYAQFPSGADHEVMIVMCGGDRYQGDDGEWLGEYDWLWTQYYGEGRDIGAHQHAANSLSPECEFAVFCSSQVHFHREGWLARMVEAREKNGPGVYGAMASFENSPHVRTCFFGCDPKDFRDYPHVINSRPKSLAFESDPDFNFAGQIQRPSWLVAWDGVYPLAEARKPENIFRRGDQSNCLVWDRHTDLYAAASAGEKAVLERLADGVKT